MMQDVGAAPLAATWIAAGLLSLAGGLSYAELCTLMPRAAGEYVFLRETFGGSVAFLSGWMRFVVGAAMTAAVAVGVGLPFFARMRTMVGTFRGAPTPGRTLPPTTPSIATVIASPILMYPESSTQHQHYESVVVLLSLPRILVTQAGGRITPLPRI